MNTDAILDKLNTEQKEAVSAMEGITTVLAGAGSGKTRVLTSKIAYMVENGISPYSILAVTFTNKAAKEMKSRLEKILGEDVVKNLWVGTFHSICGRILRMSIEKYKTEDNVTWHKNFVIYDEQESLSIIKKALKELDLDDKVYKPKTIKETISKAKGKLLNAYQFATRARSYYDDKVAQVFTIYEKELSLNNALDFDDLLIVCVKLLEQSPETREQFFNKFEHILVDEFQDTNRAQYQLIKLLFTNNQPLETLDLKHRTLCVVGDVDQSIYSWRGADYKILLNFQQDFPCAKTIKLEKNYRSVTTILEAANNVIENNMERVKKNLYSTKGQGDKIQCFEAQDQAEEAFHIAQTVKDYGAGSYKDIAVLYRTNGQSRAIEEAFMTLNVPYRMIGGLKFYERKEIKDLIAYLRLIYNPNDSAALKRIINVPKRSIGATTVKKIEDLAFEKSCSMFDILSNLEENSDLSGTTAIKLERFKNLITGLIEKYPNYLLSEFVTEVLAESGYLKELEDEDSIEAQARIDNLQELINVAKEFEEMESDDELGDFLSQVALVSDVDELKDENEAVTLMTLHSAKGLEYPVVFISGLEEGIFPHSRSRDSLSELEEERRLMYVGITRAQEKLHISYAKRRQIWGEFVYSKPSRFIFEIPQNLMDTNFNVKNDDNQNSHSTFTSAVKILETRQNTKQNTSFNNDEPVKNSSFGKNFVAPVKKQNSFGSNFVAPQIKKTTTVKKPVVSSDNKENTDNNPKFKNVISGVEQARLMAQKLKQQKTGANSAYTNQSFNTGDRVKHSKFGIGTVQSSITIGSSLIYKVEFEEYGLKAVDAEFNMMEKI